MSPFDRTQQRDEQLSTGRLLDEAVVQPIPHGNLARGIVWADILADIAADDEARRRRHDDELPEAA
ncbi:hypothetical protein [Actinophytocola sp. NPDC049390]|uniref:hypothetical protein n=1 Tax=Actinophytocola sp. NPDC049390 TaxID=3363894 RepID=UPI0037AB77D1